MPPAASGETEANGPDDPENPPASQHPAPSRWWLLVGLIVAAALSVWRCG